MRQLHLWLSIPCGVVITLICLTGAILVWEKEITQFVAPQDDAVKSETLAMLPQGRGEQDAPPLNADELKARQNKGLHNASPGGRSARHGQQTVTQVDGDSKAHRAAEQQVQSPHGGAKHKRLPFFQTVRKLHRWLLDAPVQKGASSVGKTIVGVSTIAMIVVLVSGLFVWLPRTKQGLKSRLTVYCHQGPHRFWHSTHVALGFYATIFLLVMALTGLSWSFRPYREFLITLFGVDNSGEFQRLLYIVHTGMIGGIFTKVLYCVACLIGASLPITGYYFWLKRVFRQKQKVE